MSESCFYALWFKKTSKTTLALFVLRNGHNFWYWGNCPFARNVWKALCCVDASHYLVVAWNTPISFSFFFVCDMTFICLWQACSGNKTCIVTKRNSGIFCRSFSCQFCRFCQTSWCFLFPLKFFFFILTFLTMHVRRHTDVFQTLGTPFHLCVNFAVLKDMCLLYSVCNTAVSAHTGQVCKVQMLCNVRVFNVAFLVVGFTMQSCFLKLYR